MHPNSAFRWTDPAEMRAFAAERAVAHLFAAGGMAVAHAPILVRDDGSLWFHLARGNALCGALADGAAAVASVAEQGHYISANWYADRAGSVPTWNYRAVEVAGTIRRLARDQLVAQLDALSALHEARACEDWTRAKMDPARFEAMLGAIIGFALEEAAWRGTWKMSQNKSAEVRAALEAKSGQRLEQPA
jgi:transcriptional regulator